ncbi:MAG TPA: cupin-like domain-containing protein [Casimicrobiaceae bacterium]|nr:cupin-like domain-containing protein [Casimicrobiaceae bacterium]
MNQALQQIPEWHDVDDAVFRNDIVTAYRPAVLRGIVRHWPAVRHAIESQESICRYLNGFDSGKPVDVLLMPPHVKGRIFYNDKMSGFNFTRERQSISAINDKLLRYSAFQNRPSLAVQSALIADCLPGFAEQNRLPVLDDTILPRIWLGSSVITPAHFDESNNIACVVSGRRRFTLFPPEQVANLYVGPLDYAPTGTPISMVAFREPDFRRFPRFREALAAAQVAELEPGDALYIPTLWWHHVESLAKYNVLVNYWWKGALGSTDRPDSALGCLLHGLLALKNLPPEHRAAWKAIFDHYIFSASEDQAAHIPEHRRGVLGKMSPELTKQLKAFLATQLQR